MPNGVQSLKYDTLSLTGYPIRLNDRTVEWQNIFQSGMPRCMKQKSYENGIAMN